MFKEIFNILGASYTPENPQIELFKLQEQVADWEQKANAIQAQFDFHLPSYIIDEIIENEASKNFVNLHYLINCALINEKISESNARLLKQVYSFENYR